MELYKKYEEDLKKVIKYERNLYFEKGFRDIQTILYTEWLNMD